MYPLKNISFLIAVTLFASQFSVYPARGATTTGDRMEFLIDQAALQYVSQDAEDELNDSDASRTNLRSPYERKFNRWHKRLTSKLATQQLEFNQQVDQMNEAELIRQITEAKAQAEKSGETSAVARLDEQLSNPSDLRSRLKSIFAEKARSIALETAKSIAQAGGIVPYLVNLKHELRNAGGDQANKRKAADRRIASADGTKFVLSGLIMIVGAALFFSSGLAYVGLGVFCVGLILWPHPIDFSKHR